MGISQVSTDTSDLIYLTNRKTSGKIGLIQVFIDIFEDLQVNYCNYETTRVIIFGL